MFFKFWFLISYAWLLWLTTCFTFDWRVSWYKFCIWTEMCCCCLSRQIKFPKQQLTWHLALHGFAASNIRLSFFLWRFSVSLICSFSRTFQQWKIKLVNLVTFNIHCDWWIRIFHIDNMWSEIIINFVVMRPCTKHSIALVM